MEKLSLVRPSKKLEPAIMEYKQEFFDHGEKRINGSCGITFFNEFDEWLETVTSIVSDKLSREGVHASTFFTIREYDGKIVGSIQLRHSLTEELECYGGHIGYAIRPTERKKGYGKTQLNMVLEKAKQMHIKRVMISCDSDNEASAKTIMSCGGVQECETEFRGVPLHIYWIDIETASIS